MESPFGIDFQSTILQQIIELRDHALPVRLVDTEARRPEQPRHIRRFQGLPQFLRHHTLLDQGEDVVDAHDVGLGLLHRGVELLELQSHLGVASVELDETRPQAVAQLVMQALVEERIEGDSGQIFRRQDTLGDRHQDPVELGSQNVAQHHLLRSLRLAHLLVVGQIEGQGLDSGLGVSTSEQHVDDSDRAFRAAVQVLVLLRNGQVHLQPRQFLFEAIEGRRLRRQSHGDEGLVGSFVTEEAVLVGLIGTDRHLDGRVQIHPSHITVVVVVVLESVSPKG